MSPIPNPMNRSDEPEGGVPPEVKVISSGGGFGEEVIGIEIEETGSVVGSGPGSPQDNFRLSCSSVRERVRRMRMNSPEIGIVTSLRLKMAGWCASLFRRDGRRSEINIRFEDQEVELIKGKTHQSMNYR